MPRGLFIVLIMFLGCGCAADSRSLGEATESKGTAVAFVAASTRDAVQEIVDSLAPKAISVMLDADDSSKLALQITQDAPADLFLSANEKWADFVRDKGFAKESTILLGNSLVLVVPKGNPAGLKEPNDLLKAGVKRVAIAGPTVPAGIYARQALAKLGLWKKLESERKIISGDNVRVTLAYVERGETDAGVVYATDAKISKSALAVYTFDSKAHNAIRYPLVLLKHGEGNAAARTLFQTLQSEPAKKVFARFGFTVFAGN